MHLKHGEIKSPPNVSLKSMLWTLLIDSKEDLDVDVFDIPGVCLHAEILEGKKILIIFRPEFVAIMSD